MRWLPPSVVAAVVLLAGCSAPATEIATRPNDDVTHLPTALLGAGPFSRILVEVDHAEGREPSQEALDVILGELRQLSQKEVFLVGPDRIEGIDRLQFSTRSSRDLEALHARTFQSDPDPRRVGRNGTAYLHVVFPDGVHEEATGGIFVANTVFVFLDGVPSDIVLDPVWGARAQRHVLRHEVGHALGLVNCGIPMVKAREGDRCHSANEDSIMYAGMETGAEDVLLGFVRNGDWRERTFDEDDLADLRSFVNATRGGR